MTFICFETPPLLTHAVLDFDGVVADTEQVFDDFDGAFINDFLERSGRPERLAQKAVRALAGIPFEEKLLFTARDFGFAQDPALVRSALAARMAQRATLFQTRRPALAAGLHDFLAAHGARTGLASNKTPESIAADLEAIGLSGRFAVTAGRSRHLARKPAPDIFLEAIRALQADPAHTICIGDNVIDIEAARAAGAFAAGFVIEGMDRRKEAVQKLRGAGASIVFDDFSVFCGKNPALSIAAGDEQKKDSRQ